MDVLACIEKQAVLVSKVKKRKRGKAAEDSSPALEEDDGQTSKKDDNSDDSLNLKCRFCDNTYSSIESYLQHQKVHPRAEGKEVCRLYCSSCSYSSMVIDHLRKHLMRHYNVKPFKCPICSWRCVTKHQLQQHHINHHLNLKR